MAPDPSTPLLVARGLAKSFPSGDGVIHVLRDASLAVEAGSMVAVTGRSGSGKSTLLATLMGLLRPDAGEVAIDGVALADLGEQGLARLRREVVGYVPQAPSLVGVLSAAENVEVPLRLLRTAPRERDERVMAALESVGVAARSDHRPDELSGGEQQRVAVARALVGRPRLLVADEPTAQLDHDTATRLARLLHGLVRSDGLGVVIATNDPAVAALADMVLELRDGTLHPAE